MTHSLDLNRCWCFFLIKVVVTAIGLVFICFVFVADRRLFAGLLGAGPAHQPTAGPAIAAGTESICDSLHVPSFDFFGRRLQEVHVADELVEQRRDAEMAAGRHWLRLLLLRLLLGQDDPYAIEPGEDTSNISMTKNPMAAKETQWNRFHSGGDCLKTSKDTNLADGEDARVLCVTTQELEQNSTGTPAWNNGRPRPAARRCCG